MVATIDVKTDGHVHTKYCGHASGEMEEYVLAALACGLDKLIFLEHLETGISYFESTWLSREDFGRYWQEGERLKEKYEGRISIGIGVEVGYNPTKISEINDFISRFKWDRVGISNHFHSHEGCHLNLLSRKKVNMQQFSEIGVSSVLTGYLQGVLGAVRAINGDVLCHLDAALRYHDQVEYDQGHLKIVEEILLEVAQRKISLEINTSGFPLRGEPFPALAIIEKAQRLGIEFVVGSDAHRPQDVGRYFERLPTLF